MIPNGVDGGSLSMRISRGSSTESSSGTGVLYRNNYSEHNIIYVVQYNMYYNIYVTYAPNTILINTYNYILIFTIHTKFHSHR